MANIVFETLTNVGSIQPGDLIAGERVLNVPVRITYQYPGISNITGLGAGVATALAGAFSGSGALVGSTGPTFISPTLGTPSSGTLTNCTGLPISSIASLGTGVATALAANITGSGSLVGATSPSFTTPVLGTPSSGTLTNCTGLPVGAITGLGTGVATALAANITGSGSLVGATSPSFTTPVLGTPSSGTLTNCTGLPISSIASLGTGVATALAANITGSGSLVGATSPSFTTPVLGTPSSGTLTNCTGLPSTSIVGGISGSSPAAGKQGEVITASVSNQAISSSTQTNVTSISLTAGNWIVFGNILFAPDATTSLTLGEGSISTTSATLNTTFLFADSYTSTSNRGDTCPVMMVNLSGTTTLYLVGFIVFTVSTMKVYGTITAIRVG